MMIALVAICAAIFGSAITLLLSRIEFRDEFEIEEFKKFTDALRAAK